MPEDYALRFKQAMRIIKPEGRKETYIPEARLYEAAEATGLPLSDLRRACEILSIKVIEKKA